MNKIEVSLIHFLWKKDKKKLLKNNPQKIILL